jgi:hypothetical protein
MMVRSPLHSESLKQRSVHAIWARNLSGQRAAMSVARTAEFDVEGAPAFDAILETGIGEKLCSRGIAIREHQHSSSNKQREAEGWNEAGQGAGTPKLELGRF